MSTILQDLYEKITDDLRILKTSKNEDRVVIEKLLEMVGCLSGDVYNINNIDVDFLNKVEVIKQYRQTVMNSENVDIFKSVIQNFQKIKIMTMVAVYGKIQQYGMNDYIETNSKVNFQYY